MKIWRVCSFALTALFIAHPVVGFNCIQGGPPSRARAPSSWCARATMKDTRDSNVFLTALLGVTAGLDFSTGHNARSYTTAPRRDVVLLLGLSPVLLAPEDAVAAKGDYAKMEMDGRGGDSQSSLGKNDIPAAGKVDPYDNRDKANAEYAARMSSVDLLAQTRVKACALKTQTFGVVATSIDKQDWKQAKLVLDRDLINLRRAMNLVSTKGKKAISAAQKGGEPDKVVDEAEKLERVYLNLLNKLAKSLDGAGGRKIDFNVSKQILSSMEEQWSLWEAATANF